MSLEPFEWDEDENALLVRDESGTVKLGVDQALALAIFLAHMIAAGDFGTMPQLPPDRR